MMTLWHTTLADTIGKPTCGPVSGGRHVLPITGGIREAVPVDQMGYAPDELNVGDVSQADAWMPHGRIGILLSLSWCLW